MRVVIDSAFPAASTRVAAVLREHEARGIAWSMRARLAFIVLSGIGVLFTYSTWIDLAITVGETIVGGALVGWALAQTRRRRNLAAAGLAGVVFDAVVIWMTPIAWYLAARAQGAPPAFLAKSEMAYVVAVVLAINMLALRPLYPILIALSAASAKMAFLLYAARDTRTLFTTSRLETYLEGAVQPVYLVWNGVALILAGVFLAVMARWARALIREAVAAEAENGRIREQQVELLADGRLDGLAQVVAGVAHEINSPLGAVASAVSTSERCADRVHAAVEASACAASIGQDPRYARTLSALRDGARVGEQGVGRIKHLIDSLIDFAQLDAADVQRTDLQHGLDSTLAVISETVRGGVEVVRAYGDLPPVQGRARELNQVFLTVLINAFEASQGRGTVEVSTAAEGTQAIVRIADQGPGIAPEVLDHIFEPSLGTQTRRVGMHLGLPIARRIVRRHGGTIAIDSAVGSGTTVEIRLPI